MIRFAAWWFLLLIPPLIWLFWALRNKRGLPFSSVNLLQQAGSGKKFKANIGKTLVLCAFILLVIALARPQTSEKVEFIPQQGIDIAVLLDLSVSMLYTDFTPNRLEAARGTMDHFISERVNDRISLIIFAGSAYTRVPLTLDHNVVRQSLANVSWRNVNQSGTAIGLAIAVGVNRLNKSESASKVMILVTDGVNNIDTIDPLVASTLAQANGIRIYTIGMATGETLARNTSQYGSQVDEKMLMSIAANTGGQFFRATDADAMSQIFATIDQLEKTEFKEDFFIDYTDLAYPLIKLALLLLLAGIILDRFYFVQIP